MSDKTSVQQDVDPLLQSVIDAPQEITSIAAILTSRRPTASGEELETSRRERRLMSMSFSKNMESIDLMASLRSLGSVSSPRRKFSLRTRSGSSEGLERAVAMLQTYPLMSVDNTAFGNQIGRRGTLESMELIPSTRSNAASYSNLDFAEIGESSITDLNGALERLRPSNSVVALAARIKRACMWETIIINFLAHRAWSESFRYYRLRAVLEAHLLPAILRRRGESGEIGKLTRNPIQHLPTELRDDEGQKPQGSFLMEQSPFLASFGSLKFCDAIAETVHRFRFSAGETIVNVGSPSQDAMYILISGKCDAIRPATDVKTVKRTRLESGSSFGGLFGGKSTFTDKYRAVSKCIVWVVKRESFETLFLQYADDRMKDIFLQALKENMMERLLKLYPLPQCMSRVPIYRRIDNEIEEYAKDFKPLVLTYGDILFNEGDPPGAVYCLVEGHVLREQLLNDISSENSTRQILSPNDSENNFALSTRFILLGEEPHILPGPLRYKCTVVSRAALFFKIEGERFVNALLDDAKLFIQLREKLTSQTRMWMKLSPEALLTVPILKNMSLSHLYTIANAAEPRVVERSISICEPAQNIREIYLLTAGDVRDPRMFNRIPTQPVSPPVSESEDSVEVTNIKGKKEKPTKLNAIINREKEGKISKFPSITDHHTSHRSHRTFDNGVQITDESKKTAVWCFLNATDEDSKENIIYPDEQQDISPPLPPNPAKTIYSIIGGGWEGLLLEKWPNGWETTTTVQLWAIPMLIIRTEFNSMPKSTQNLILSYARNMQMRELGLPNPIIAKLPPMNVYLPPEKRLTRHSLGLEKNTVPEKGGTARERGRVSHSRRTPGSVHSRDVSTVGGSKPGRATGGELSLSQDSTLTESLLSSSAYIAFSQNKKTPTKRSPKRSPRPPLHSKLPTSSNIRNVKKQNEIQNSIKEVTPEEHEEEIQVDVRKPKAGPPPLLFLRKNAPKSIEEPPEITPELCAIYAGKEPQKGIITHPSQLKDGKKENILKTSSSTEISSSLIDSWPVTSGRKKEWFHVVPHYAPLPGTINNQNYITSVPSLVPNTAMMVRREKGHGKVLASQAAFFTTLAQKRREVNAAAGEVPISPNKGNIKGISPSTSMQSISPRGIDRPLPGRHVYRL